MDKNIQYLQFVHITVGMTTLFLQVSVFSSNLQLDNLNIIYSLIYSKLHNILREYFINATTFRTKMNIYTINAVYIHTLMF